MKKLEISIIHEPNGIDMINHRLIVSLNLCAIKIRVQDFELKGNSFVGFSPQKEETDFFREVILIEMTF